MFQSVYCVTQSNQKKINKINKINGETVQDTGLGCLGHHCANTHCINSTVGLSAVHGNIWILAQIEGHDSGWENWNTQK